MCAFSSSSGSKASLLSPEVEAEGREMHAKKKESRHVDETRRLRSKLSEGNSCSLMSLPSHLAMNDRVPGRLGGCCRDFPAHHPC